MKKYNKVCALILIGAVTLSLAACGKTDNVQVDPSGSASEEVGMPNPMVEITDPAEFTDKLGITINPKELADETKLFIISNQIAHVAFTIQGVDGNDVDVIFRASKEDGDITGIYDDTLVDETMEYEGLSIVNRYSETTNNTIYLFSKDDINYSLALNGEVSQMLIGELLDSALIACGIM